MADDTLGGSNIFDLRAIALSRVPLIYAHNLVCERL